MIYADVAIITPFKNGEKFINQYLNNLFKQTYKKWKCYLIDDGSDDNSLGLLLKLLKNDSRFVILKSNDNGKSIGPAKSRNIGLSVSCEPYICFLDIDDLWSPEKLKYQTKYFKDNKLDICVTSYLRFFNNKGNYCDIIKPPSSLNYKKLLQKNHIPLLSVLLKRELYYLYFPDTRHEDYSMWLNIFKYNKHIRYGSINKILCFYRLHSSNLTSNKLKMIWWTFKAFKKHGFGNSKSLILLIRWIILKLFNISKKFLKPTSNKEFKIDYIYKNYYQ